MKKSSTACRRFVSTLSLLLVLTVAPAALGLGGDVAATVDGITITQAEVDSSISTKLLALEQQAYALRKSALESLIASTLLQREAQKNGVSLEAMRETLTAVDVRVDQAEVDKLYDEHRGAFGAMSVDEVKERLRMDLQSQKRITAYRESIDRLRAQADIHISLAAPRVNAGDPDKEELPSRGPKEARVVITTFGDYECEYCKKADAALGDIADAYSEDVRLVFRHFPLPSHANSIIAARAAWCAGQQNRFWEYHEALVAAPAILPDTLRRITSTLGLDEKRFEGCRTSDASRAAIEKDLQAGRNIGVASTPSFVVNGRLVPGGGDLSALRRIVTEELTKHTTARAGNERTEGMK